MILQALVRLYEALEADGKVPESGWCRAKVSYAIDLDQNGELKGILSLMTEESRGKKSIWVPSVLRVPEMSAHQSGISANFLCDNSKYILGIDARENQESQDDQEKQKSQKRQERARRCFQAAKEKHLDVLSGLHSPLAEAVRNFFLSWEPEKAEEHPILKDKWDEVTAGNLVFIMGIQYAQDDEEIQQAWDTCIRRENGGKEGICLVTGQETGIARIHSPVKGIGSQPNGVSLVSFNEPSFKSYEKEQGYNAPVGTYAAFAYTTALNYLLSQKKYVVSIGDTAVVFWSENGDDAYQEVYFSSLEPVEDNQEIIRGIFDNLEKGEAVAIHDIRLDMKQKFYILGLAPNAARLSVRFFYEDHFGNILLHLKEHYDRMEVARPQNDHREYLGLWRMLQETVNQKSKDKKVIPGMAAGVVKAILSGSRYPDSLYQAVLLRIRAEQGTGKITRGRAAIIKAFLLRNSILKGEKGDDFVGLNEERNDTAYVLGREFAVLESIQEAANPGINATIKDRYYNSACTTPAVIFPVLFRLKNSHIRKIQETNRRIYFEKMLTELQGRISDYPARLRLEEQGLFHLGYYHQMQKRYEKKEEV